MYTVRNLPLPLPMGWKLCLLELHCTKFNVSLLYIAVTRKCGISKRDILNKPKFSQVIPDFVNWINCLIKEVSLVTRTQHFPGMVTGMEI